MKKLFIALSLVTFFSLESSAQWKPAGDKIKTEWAEQIDPSNVLPEYPRPGLRPCGPKWRPGTRRTEPPCIGKFSAATTTSKPSADCAVQKRSAAGSCDRRQSAPICWKESSGSFRRSPERLPDMRKSGCRGLFVMCGKSRNFPEQENFRLCA